MPYMYIIKHTNGWFLDQHGRWVDDYSQAEQFDSMQVAAIVAAKYEYAYVKTVHL